MKNRTVLVTGGMGGLGESICTKLADLKYTVVTTYSPSNKNAEAWLAQMKEQGYNFKAYAWQQYNKFSQGKNAKNMWVEDARRLGRPI